MSPRGPSTLPTGSRFAIGALFATAVATVLAATLDPPLWVVVLIAGIPLGFGLASEATAVRDRRHEHAEAQRRRDEEAAAKEAEWLREARICLRSWPAPLVADVDPFVLGIVHPKVAEPHAVGPGLNPYVPRDIDARAAEALRASGLLLLVGEPGSGVTRTAYEVAKADATARKVLIPVPPEGPSRALVTLDVVSRLKGAHVTLWLDRIDRFSAGGLTKEMLDLCRKSSSGLRVIATIPSHGLATWAAAEPELRSAFGKHVMVRRLPSPAEQTRAAEVYPGLDVSRGIGAAFTGLTSLLDRLDTGDDQCPAEPEGADCALAKTVVDAAIGWRATGTPRPLTVPLLTSLARQVLRLPADPDAAHLTHALAWATAPVREGVALLTAGTVDANGDDVGIRPHPDVADLRWSTAIPDSGVWSTALADAHDAGDTASVGQIGFTAHVCDMQDVERQAWALVPSLDDPGATWIGKALNHSRAAHRARGELLPLDRLLELISEAYGAESVDVARILNDLGSAWRALGQPGTALPLHVRALAIFEREYGPDHVDVARILDDVGNTWQELGRPGTALPLLERALAIFEREYGPDHIDVARTLDDLGATWQELGQPGTALHLHERALAIFEREYGPDHIDVTSTLGNLGNARSALGHPKAALPLHERALAIKEPEYGPDHIEVARTLGNLGATWQELGQPRTALPLLERALAIFEREYGPDHIDVARTLNNLGATWQELGEPGTALPLHERALTIKEREYGPDHIEVARTLVNLGITRQELGEPGTALPLHERALTIKEREYGPDHIEVARTLVNLGITRQELGQPRTALPLHERALAILRANLPAGHPDVARAEMLLRDEAPDVIPLPDGSVVHRAGGPAPSDAGRE